MLMRGLIAVSTLIFALSLSGCGEREQAKEDTEETTVSTSVEKPSGEVTSETNKVTEEKKSEAAAAPASPCRPTRSRRVRPWRVRAGHRC